MPNSLLQFYHYLYRVAAPMLHWALFLQDEQRNVAKSGQTPAISNSVAIRRHVGKVQKHPEHISKGSEFSTDREDNATFSFLHNVELIPENSGTENCKFEIFKLENTNAHNVELIPDNLGIENYRFKNAKLENTNATFSIFG